MHQIDTTIKQVHFKNLCSRLRTR